VATLWDGHAAVWHGKQECCELCVSICARHWDRYLSILFIEKFLKKYNGSGIHNSSLSICMYCA
jgi:hypothetical protein